jgi:hypothetical protein
MQWYWFVLGALGVWRLTHLLNAEDGPAEVLVRFRRLAGNGFWGSLLDCFYCLSIWIAAPFAMVLGASWTERILLWLALSGAASLLERATQRADAAVPAAQYFELNEENENVLLRKGKESVSDGGAERTGGHAGGA